MKSHYIVLAVLLLTEIHLPLQAYVTKPGPFQFLLYLFSLCMYMGVYVPQCVYKSEDNL